MRQRSSRLHPRGTKHCIESLEGRRLFAASFLAPVTSNLVSTISGTGALRTVSGDLNGDGIPDLVSVYPDGTGMIYLGSATGTFTVSQTFSTNGKFVALGDFTGDGVLDIATASGIIPGTGSGAFSATLVGYTLPANAVGLVSGDFNGDGKLDLAVETLDTSGATPTLGVSVLLGNGNGAFGAPISTTVGSASGIGAQYANFLTADFNGDGKLDLLTPFGVMLGNGLGGFSRPIALPLGASPSTPIYTVADFNGDGKPDVSVLPAGSSSASGAGQIELLFGKGDGTFTDAGPISIGAATVTSLAASDVNNDNLPDLIVGNTASGSSSSVAVLQNKGSGTFAPPSFYAVTGTPLAIATGDFNADKNIDLISFNGSAGVNPLNQTTTELSASVLLNATPAAVTPTVTLRSSQNPAVAGVAVQFTATVAAPAGQSTTPTGNVTFYDGTTPLGTAALTSAANGSAKATLSSSSLPAGSRNITAYYAGDTSYSATTSVAVKQVVLLTASKTPLVAVSVNSVSLPALFISGDKGTASLTIGNYGGAAANGIVSVKLYASTDGVIDANAIALSTPSLNRISIGIGSGGSRTLSASFVAGSYSAGAYSILAQVTPVSGLTPDQVSQTVGVSPATFEATGNVFGTVGKHKNLKATVVNASGVSAVLSLSGPGTGTVTQNASGQTQVTVTGSLISSALTVTTRGGTFVFDQFNISGPVGTFTARSSSISGSLSIGGGVRTLTLGSAAPITTGAAGPTITLAANGISSSLTFGAISETTLDSTQPVRTLTATSWSGGSMIAPSIGTLTVRGDLSANIFTHSRGRITSATAGSISGGNWAIAGGIGTLRVNGPVANANLFAGADSGADNVLATADDLYAAATINSVQISGAMTTSLIAAGVAIASGATIVPGSDLDPSLRLLPKGVIGSIVVKGPVSSDSRFLAVKLPATAVIAGARLATAGDARFAI